MSEGHFEAAARHYALAAADEPNNAARWRDLARAGLLAERPIHARRAFRRLARLRPNDPRPVVEIGFTQELERDYDQALATYLEAVVVDPEDAYPYRVLGTRLLRWGKADEAIEPLARSVEIDPSHPETWKALGLAHHAAGQADASESAFRAGLEHHPSDLGLNLSLAALLINAGRFEPALEIYYRLIEVLPRFAAAHVGRSLILHELGRENEAESALIRAVAVADDPARYERRLQAYRALRRGGASESETNTPNLDPNPNPTE